MDYCSIDYFCEFYAFVQYLYSQTVTEIYKNKNEIHIICFSLGYFILDINVVNSAQFIDFIVVLCARKLQVISGGVLSECS